jgi:hypothetical protein
MASLSGGLISQGKSYHQQNQKTFLTSQAFNAKLFTYATSINSNFQTVGTLTANANATATNCPANRVLHTNGRVLVPGANPGVNSPLIGVYDPISALNGFIDPTDPAFANYDTNMPYQYDLGISSVIATLGGTGANARVGTDSGRLAATAANSAVNAGTSGIGEFAFFTTGVNTSSITVSSSQVIPTSRIFLTQTTSAATPWAFSTLFFGLPPIPTVSSITTGSFQVSFPAPLYPNDLRAYNWVVM